MKKPGSIVRERRRVRGEPDETRARLVAAAALEFEKNGYYKTDSNRIARAAGYAPGSFYKHFKDKLEVFLAVYDVWVDNEWNEIEARASSPAAPNARLEAVVDFLIGHHHRWKGFRAALRALVETEPTIRKRHRAARKTHVARLRALGPAFDDPLRAAFALLLVERVGEAIASGELAELGISEADARSALLQRLRAKESA